AEKSKDGKHHKQCNREPDQAATAKCLYAGPAKRGCEVKSDTPPTSPPHTPTTVSATPTHPLQHPILKKTYWLLCSIGSPPDQKAA
ncbi:hypothetical protein A2U01_0079189, partial [Trifolium medium]|nr:hypothetical protein [Trifolium medium]